jgi:hypothetical protein
MSNSESRWGALRACATAIMVVLCSVLGQSTAQADDEIVGERLEGSTSVTVVPSSNESAYKNAPEDSRDPQRSEEKQKRPIEASAEPPVTNVVSVPVPMPQLPAEILTPPNAVLIPSFAQSPTSADAAAMAQPTASSTGPAVAATAQPTTSPDAPAVAATAQPTASPTAPTVAATAQPTTSPDATAMPATAQPTASPDAPALAATAQPTDSAAGIASSEAASDQGRSSPTVTPITDASSNQPIDPELLPDPAIVDPAGAEPVEAEVVDEPWTAERTIALLTERALVHGSAVYEVLAVARCETGYTFMPWRENGYLRRGSLGEVGVGQWLPPVERNHWGRTPHWREHQYHILAAYVQGDPSAIWWDADALAWSMGPAAPSGFRSGWSCWRIRGPWWFV